MTDFLIASDRLVLRRETLTDDELAQVEDMVSQLTNRPYFPPDCHADRLKFAILYLNKRFLSAGRLQRTSLTASGFYQAVEAAGHTVTGDWVAAYIEAWEDLVALVSGQVER